MDSGYHQSCAVSHTCMVMVGGFFGGREGGRGKTKELGSQVFFFFEPHLPDTLSHQPCDSSTMLCSSSCFPVFTSHLPSKTMVSLLTVVLWNYLLYPLINSFVFFVRLLLGYLLLFSNYALQPLRLIVRSGLDVPTLATRRLHACHHARAPSGGRWNCGREMSGKFCLNADFQVTFRDLLHAVKLRHVADSFTSPPKEGVLRIFFRPKNPRASAGCEPANLCTKGQHATSRPPKPLSLGIRNLSAKQSLQFSLLDV